MYSENKTELHKPDEISKNRLRVDWLYSENKDRVRPAWCIRQKPTELDQPGVFGK